MKREEATMSKKISFLLYAAAFAFAATGAAYSAEGAVHEPTRFHQGDLHGPTALTLMGATPPAKNELDIVAKTINLANLAKVAAKENPLLLDVSTKEYATRPNYVSVPGAVLLVDVGNGTDDRAFMEAYAKRIHALTGGDLHKPIMVFSHPDDWSGYNAAKRLVYLGYRHIRWYRDGVEGWVKGGHPTTPVTPDTRWSMTLAGLRTKTAP
jgi:PQQ-dependent catabolism-associated CXXCW motif protein